MDDYDIETIAGEIGGTVEFGLGPHPDRDGEVLMWISEGDWDEDEAHLYAMRECTRGQAVPEAISLFDEVMGEHDDEAKDAIGSLVRQFLCAPAGMRVDILVHRDIVERREL